MKTAKPGPPRHHPDHYHGAHPGINHGCPDTHYPGTTTTSTVPTHHAATWSSRLRTTVLFTRLHLISRTAGNQLFIISLLLVY